MVQQHNVFMTGIQDRYRVLFPTPFEEEYPDGEYILKEVYDTTELYSFYCNTQNGNLDIKIVKDITLEGEEHYICVNAEGVSITYHTDEGLFRALTSVRQLIIYGQGHCIPFADIHDKPEFKIRAYLDCKSNNRFTLKALFRLVDYIAGLKYNELELFMNDTPDGFVYEKFPYIKAHVDDLTKEDLCELDKYCKARFVNVIVTLNCFGHLCDWLKRDEFKHLEISDGETRTGSLNILHPEAEGFVEKIFDSVLPYYSADIAHIGLDEAFGLGKFQLEEICKEQGKDKVFLDWAEKMTKLVKEKYSKRSYMCTDMFMDMPANLQCLPKDIILREWGYETMNFQLVDANCRKWNEQGYRFIVVSSTGSWASLAGRFDTAVDNIRTYAEVGQKYGAEGYAVTSWNEESYAWDLIPTAIAAQYAWNVGHKQHGGWTKRYYVRNAQDYVDKYVFGGAKVSRDICKLANTYHLEPEYVACGTIIHQMLRLPLSQNIKRDFYDVTELYEEFHVDHIIEYVNKLIEKINAVDFTEVYKREIIADAKTIILGAEYIRIRLRGEVSRKKANELKALSELLVSEHTACKKEKGYKDTFHQFAEILPLRAAELDLFIVD